MEKTKIRRDLLYRSYLRHQDHTEKASLSRLPVAFFSYPI